ncbi:MAG: 16S rRNA (uracil(1498)-N(3))-methyltransferase [Phycisphaerales bacterium]|nr:16S rRNA (uracil(1498)-N(3))-methyltransferase [Phycisphaerales bacterium]
MTRHRFHCSNLAAGRVALEPHEAQHATRVLRLPVGTEIDLFDGAGTTAVGTIAEANRSAVAVEVADITRHAAPTGIQVEIITALPRAQRQQFVFEKCTELGVATIRPIVTARSTVKPQRDAVEKWQRMCIEAGKQSGCLYVPKVESPLSLSESFAAHGPDHLRLLATTTGDAMPLRDAIARADHTQRVAVWIGPEGGFTDEECSAAVAERIVPVTLGPRVLRIETAAVAVAAWCGLCGESADNR